MFFKFIKSNVTQWIFGIIFIFFALTSFQGRYFTFFTVLSAIIFLICGLLTIRPTRLAWYRKIDKEKAKKGKTVVHSSKTTIAIIAILLFSALAMSGANIKDSNPDTNNTKATNSSSPATPSSDSSSNEQESNGVTYTADPAKAFIDDNGMTIVRACRGYVEQGLVSPSTADFQNIFDESNRVNNAGNNVYNLYSFVDSQNSFGATIRTSFDCKVKYNGGDASDENSYDLVSVNPVQ